MCLRNTGCLRPIRRRSGLRPLCSVIPALGHPRTSSLWRCLCGARPLWCFGIRPVIVVGGYGSSDARPFRARLLWRPPALGLQEVTCSAVAQVFTPSALRRSAFAPLARSSRRLAAGCRRSSVIGAPRRAAALWRSASLGALGSPAIYRSGDQPPWRSAALALSRSGAQLLPVVIHAFTWPTAPRSPDTPLRPLWSSAAPDIGSSSYRDARSTELDRVGARHACLFHMHACTRMPRICCCILFFCVC